MQEFVIKLSGGLGNQMFQYAFAKALAVRYNTSFKLDASNYLSNEDARQLELNIFPNICEDAEESFLTKYLQGKKFPYRQLHSIMSYSPIDFVLKAGRVYFEKQHTMEEHLKYLTGNKEKPLFHKMFIGNWQNEDFFSDCASCIRESFVFKENLLPRTHSLVKQLESTCDSVSLHIRRGDYLSPQYSRFYNGICTKEYYENARRFIEERKQNPLYVVFSDDIQWCRSNMALPGKTIYVDWNTGVNSWQDMFLMSKCRHHIIANSSFSWWGAWLGNIHNDSITIAPERWYADETWQKEAGRFVAPDYWVKIGSMSNCCHK